MGIFFDQNVKSWLVVVSWDFGYDASIKLNIAYVLMAYIFKEIF